MVISSSGWLLRAFRRMPLYLDYYHDNCKRYYSNYDRSWSNIISDECSVCHDNLLNDVIVGHIPVFNHDLVAIRKLLSLGVVNRGSVKSYWRNYINIPNPNFRDVSVFRVILEEHKRKTYSNKGVPLYKYHGENRYKANMFVGEYTCYIRRRLQHRRVRH